jgi:hypothetical protein
MHRVILGLQPPAVIRPLRPGIAAASALFSSEPDRNAAAPQASAISGEAGRGRWPHPTIVRASFIMRDGEITRKDASQPVRFNETPQPVG